MQRTDMFQHRINVQHADIPDIRTAEYRRDPRQPGGIRQFQIHNASPRRRAAGEGNMQDIIGENVGNKTSLTRDQAPILPPGNGTSDCIWASIVHAD